MGCLEKTVVVGQFLNLFTRNLGEVLSSIAHVDAPKACHGIEHLMSIGIPKVDAFSALNDSGTGFVHPFVIGKRMQKVGVIKRLIFGGAKRHT